MGQGQSSNNDIAGEVPVQADYYELLGVERIATDEEIKKAYRRKALELHPDRNYGNVDNATTLFAEIQSAYEVLSDPQERAWYDSHRDLLLRGDQAADAGGDEYSYNIRLTTTEEVLKLMLKFNGKLEYSDSPDGFYGGLREFFNKLAKEEDIACQWENQQSMDYPDFGSKEDDYEDVVRPFYAVWAGFATRKTYSWKDAYRLSEAPDRRIRRIMEKENKKLRDEALQEYNDAVRSLVLFVRKRDPRFQKNQKSEAERQRILREAAAAQAAKSRAARQAKLGKLDDAVIPDWSQSQTVDQHEGGFSSESDVEEHEYECVVCDKIFKSEAQFQAHERSKKHVKLLRQLKKEMREEGTELDLGTQSDIADSRIDEDSTETTDQVHDARNVEEFSNLSGDTLDRTAMEAEKNVKDDHAESKPESLEPSDLSDDDYAPRSAVEQRLDGTGVDTMTAKFQDIELNGTPMTSDTESMQQPKMGKAKQKRAKKAAQQTGGGASGMISDFKCVVCQAEFPSKTKLFNHIQAKGHAAPVAQTKGFGGQAGKGKKR